MVAEVVSDMAPIPDEDRAKLFKLLAAIKQSEDRNGEVPLIFSREEHQILLEIITWWIGMKAIGRFSQVVGFIFRFASLAFGAYLAWRAGILPSWFYNFVTGQK
jgi:hypothetical protein